MFLDETPRVVRKGAVRTKKNITSVATINAIRMKITNCGSRRSLSADKKAHGLAPLRAGGVLGIAKQNRPSTSEKNPPSHRLSAPPRPGKPCSSGQMYRRPLSIPAAAIQPMVPKTRTSPNFFSASGRWWNVIEFVSASVGA
jgi:hypothetical protein